MSVCSLICIAKWKKSNMLIGVSLHGNFSVFHVFFFFFFQGTTLSTVSQLSLKTIQ